MKLKKIIALLLAAALMVATLTGCSKKAPAEAFFELYDEIYALEYMEQDMDMDLTLTEGGEPMTLDIQLKAVGSKTVASMEGSMSAGGDTLQIPTITVTEAGLYLDGPATAALLSMFGLDYDGSLAELIGSAAIALEITAEEQADSAALIKEATALIDPIAEKVKAVITAKEGAIVADEANEGTYTLTLDGPFLLELVELILNDVIANQDAWIDYITKNLSAEEAEEAGLDEATLKDAFAELEDGLAELKDDPDYQTLVDVFSGLTFQVSVSKDKEKNYNVDMVIIFSFEGDELKLTIDETIKPLKEAPAITAPADTISLEDVVNAAIGSMYGYDDYDDYEYQDDYEYEEDDLYTDEEYEYGSVEDLDLTPVNSDINEITFWSWNGSAVTVPVPDAVNWDNAIIDSSLLNVIVSDDNYDCYCTYTSTSREGFDLETVVNEYNFYYQDEDGNSPLTATELYTNADGSASYMALTGEYAGYDLYDAVIAVEISADEVAMINITDYMGGQYLEPVLAYYGLEMVK